MPANLGAALSTSRAPMKRTASAQWWHTVCLRNGGRPRRLHRQIALPFGIVRQSWRTTGTAAECKGHGVHVFRLHRSRLNSWAVHICCSNSLPVKASLLLRLGGSCRSSSSSTLYSKIQILAWSNKFSFIADTDTHASLRAQLWYGSYKDKCGDLCDRLVYFG